MAAEMVGLSWETCPPEILIMIFEETSVKTLSSCMFVNSKWKRLVEHVLEKHNKWQEMVDTVLINKGQQLTEKSNQSLTLQQIYYNSLLWNNFQRANISLNVVHDVINIKKIYIYREFVILVSFHNVCYYRADTFALARDLKLRCHDFIENDHMSVVVNDSKDRYMRLEMFGKEVPNNFDIWKVNKKPVSDVIFYKIQENRCYVLDYRNCLVVYAFIDSHWKQKIAARYYGSSYEICNLHVYDEEIFLLLSSGVIYWVDMQTRNFKKILTVYHFPVLENTRIIYSKMFHKFGFVFRIDDTRPIDVQRFTLNNSNVFVYKLPKVSCVTEHGDILLVGYINGTVDFFLPRDLSKTEPIRRLNVKDLVPHIDDVTVYSVDVQEDNGFQHLFITTISRIIHLKISYPGCDTYMWREYINFVDIVPDFSMDGILSESGSRSLDKHED